MCFQLLRPHSWNVDRRTNADAKSAKNRIFVSIINFLHARSLVYYNDTNGSITLIFCQNNHPEITDNPRLFTPPPPPSNPSPTVCTLISLL